MRWPGSSSTCRLGRRVALGLALGLVLARAVAAQTPAASPAGALRGRLLDADTGQPLPGAVVRIVGTSLGAAAGADGTWRIVGLSPGPQTVEATHIGYRPARRQVTVTADVEAFLDLALAPEAIRLRAVTVTPSRFAIMGAEAHTQQALTEDELQSIPHVGEDVYRAVTRLPGVSGSDFSAKFTVRGGEHDEVLVLLDGLQLDEPFHLKDIDGGALSIVDVEVIEGIDLLTGAFPVEYGDRTSGVFHIRSRTPAPGTRRTTVGLSFMNARVMSEGTFDGGSWLLSARRGYLDMVLWLMGEDESIDPRYYDVMGKVEYELSESQRLSLHALHAGDTFDLVEDDDDASQTAYGNSYLWANLLSTLSPTASARTTLSLGRIATDRDGTGLLDDRRTPDYLVHDRRRVGTLGLRQDWDWERSARHYLKWGLDARLLRADYDYLSTDAIAYVDNGQGPLWRTDTTAVDRIPQGHSLGLYAADRVRLSKRLTAEVGLRYDRASHTGDAALSPRLNLAWSPDAATAWRLGWGYFRQSQGIHQLAVQDGDSTFYGAERAEHRVLSWERLLDAHTQLRAELYWKKLTDLRPAYRNIRHDIEIFPELIDDRIRLEVRDTRARGLELYVKRDDGGRCTWWASYAWARVREHVDRISSQAGSVAVDRTLPGLYDQRHTIYLDVNLRPTPRWHLNLAWQYRSGWPYTDLILRSGRGSDGNTYYWTEWGRPQAERFPAFHRLDLRLSRRFRARGGRLDAYLELVNVYDHGNVQAYNYWWVEDESGVRLRKVPDYWFRLLPSLGVSWTWGA